MAQNQNNPAQAWDAFAATGRVQDYLRYRQAQNQAEQTKHTADTGGQARAVSGNHPARRQQQRKRPPDHGAYQ